jgi:hypothetical protein
MPYLTFPMDQVDHYIKLKIDQKKHSISFKNGVAEVDPVY